MIHMCAKEHSIIRSGFEVVKIVDGDGLIVRNIFDKKEEEVRLYGIDAPETKRGDKLKQDERELHIPGSFLWTLGYKSFDFLRNRIKPGRKVTLVQESSNLTDKYGRTLAYVLLPIGKSINELMLENGFAKPYDKVYCEKLPIYQAISLRAKSKKKGLFKEVRTF
jgi:micrococcal nuclease